MAGDQVRDDLLDAVGVGLGQEADVTGVDAHQGDVPFAGDLEGAQDRAVAAEHQDKVDAVGAVRADRLNTSGARATALAVGALGLGTGTGLSLSSRCSSMTREILRPCCSVPGCCEDR